jgi:endonuclease/exonuclease/phosphatase family metal-dependent hydrolase
MLSVGTLNLWGVWADWPGRLSVLLRRLPEVAPDVLALQEVVARPGFDQARVLAELLEYPHLAYAVGHEEPPGVEGIAVLSRHPFRGRRTVALPASLPPRQALEVDVALPDGPQVRVRCAHTVGPPGPVQDAQVRELLAWPCEGPTVLLGDLNQEEHQFSSLLAASPYVPAVPPTALASWPTSAETFRSAWIANLGHAPRFPLAPRRLDHILVHGLSPVSASVDLLHDGGLFASDHALVRADLRPGRDGTGT